MSKGRLNSDCLIHGHGYINVVSMGASALIMVAIYAAMDVINAIYDFISLSLSLSISLSPSVCARVCVHISMYCVDRLVDRSRGD